MSSARRIDKTGLYSLLQGHRAAGVTLLDQNSPVPRGADLKKCILVSDSLDGEGALNWVLDAKVAHVCPSDVESVGLDLNSAAIMMSDPDLFFRFPIATILSPDRPDAKQESQLQRWEVSFSAATDKKRVLNEAKSALTAVSKAQSICDDAALIVDELFTNAVFNAPFVNSKSNYNPGKSREDHSITMGPHHKGQIFIGADDKRIVIGCRDPFGSLGVEPLLRRIRDCWRTGVSHNIRMGSGGAGIGSFLVFTLSAGLYIAVRPGLETVICSTIYYKWSGRRRSEAAKALHLIDGK